ncbi:MAG: SGNH/GDSL hydrolase family protein [Flavobacterium sp.]|uniref:SGNH/GDSL hydrolase family protein n=1 Tax=Flavobacterium sp. TaxID=239 RepID=UPI00120FAC1D|nr:SGNH/GDSL hydrolase family protein [Flavobacterium sp.]RZJ66026.1 MAG: SGNH/GDSL hydrolase family protein [Flavobacterium sp.]
MKSIFFTILFASVFCMGCNSDDKGSTSQNPDPTNPTPTNPNPTDPTPTNPNAIRYIALGDSYTIGQNVCETCRFPAQLKAALSAQTMREVNLEIIATTGWTTTNLISAISSNDPDSNHDLVTLLIGVNNQYQHKPFSVYQQEFPQLVNTAISLAQGDKDNVIVVSIPDYAYTPYGQGSSPEYQAIISSEIDQYNAFAQSYCETNGIVFVDITDITRQGLMYPSLVASDGLHPSESAYASFVERLLPKAIIAVE